MGKSHSSIIIEQTTAKPLPVCKFYLQKGCKHGKKGTGCHFSHPKLCFSFIKRGDKQGGCKKGEKCNYVHPNLCRRALNTRVCINTRCRSYHVTGTKFSLPTDEISGNTSVQQEAKQMPKNIIQRPAVNRDGRLHEKVSSGSEPNHDNSSSHQSIHGNLGGRERLVQNERFLEMKQQIRSMQDQMMLLVSMLKPPTHPQPTTMGWGTR